MLINLWDKLTCLNGIITPKSVNCLKDEFSGIITVIKTHHYKQGQKYGHLASAIPKVKYRIVIGNPAWTYAVSLDPMVYSLAALALQCSCTMQAACGPAQNTGKESRQLPTSQRSGQGIDTICSGRQCTCPSQETVHWIWGRNCARDDQPPLHTKNDKDDHGPEARVPHDWLQQQMGLNNKHDCILHTAQPLPSIPQRPQHCYKQEKKVMVAGAQMWTSEMFREQTHNQPNLGKPTCIFNQKMA